MGEALKQRLQIQFVDVHGMPEAGVDGGGLFKDLMENIVKEGFNPQLGLFLATSDNRLYPNPNASLAMEQAIPAFEFLGRMLGKAMYEVRFRNKTPDSWPLRCCSRVQLRSRGVHTPHVVGAACHWRTSGLCKEAGWCTAR